jgi:hypothetical protein
MVRGMKILQRLYWRYLDQGFLGQIMSSERPEQGQLSVKALSLWLILP